MTKKEKIIIAVLSIIFVGVSLGAFWDLYGKQHICIGNCPSVPAQTDRTDRQAPPAPADGSSLRNDNKQAKAKVDEKLFSSCTEGATENKACKDCCDGLDQDVTVIQACKKSCNTIGQ